jgi:hypothetical protein
MLTGQLAATVGIEPTSYTLTACCIALMLDGKIKWSGLRESNSRSAVGSRKPSLSAKPAQYFPKLLKNNR